MIEKTNFTNSPLRKALEKQTKTIKDQGKKQVEALKISKPNVQYSTIKYVILKVQLNEKSKNWIGRIKETKKMVNRKDLKF